MSAKKTSSKRAFTIIEAMIAIVVLFVAILGTSAYRYGAALAAYRADLHTTASRTALLLCEGWNGTSGSTSYDPVATMYTDLNISTTSVGPDVPSGFTSLGSYKIVLENTDYYATLSWRDLATGLRALNVIVGWNQGGGGSSFNDVNKTYRLTTYVENPSP